MAIGETDVPITVESDEIILVDEFDISHEELLKKLRHNSQVQARMLAYIKTFEGHAVPVAEEWLPQFQLGGVDATFGSVSGSKMVFGNFFLISGHANSWNGSGTGVLTVDNVPLTMTVSAGNSAQVYTSGTALSGVGIINNAGTNVLKFYKNLSGAAAGTISNTDITTGSTIRFQYWGRGS